MTLVAGRMLSLHSYGEEANKQGILKSGPTRRPNRPEVDLYFDKPADTGPRQDDGKRLVRFCEADESEKNYGRDRNSTKSGSQDVIQFGSNMYVINNSDPNSAVSKLFPNSKLTPINPFVNRSVVRDRNPNQLIMGKNLEINYYLQNQTKSKYNNEDSMRNTDRKTDRGTTRRNFQKIQSETRLKPVKTNNSATPLIERIKQLTCESDEISCIKERSKFDNSRKELEKPKNQDVKLYVQTQSKVEDLSSLSKESMNLVRYNQNISSHTRSHQTPDKKITSPTKTDEARRSFLSSLAQQNDGAPGDRTSVATNSTTADTVYSLSDIEEVLTEEEKEIKDAFAQEIKQDELELFVQQDAGRTERLRKRYSSTPKLEGQTQKTFSNSNYIPSNNQKQYASYFASDNINSLKDKPKFGSTIEILQQLQQQIETPYQLEGRRTACSNYSDSSIPISDRLFGGDESSDGYEPVLPKPHVHRTCSLDSKNYEEIDNFSSAFSVPRTKSHEHPRLTQLESDPYVYASSSVVYPGSFIQRNQPLEQSIYASSPDLHGYRHNMFPDRVSSYNNHPLVGRQLHPVLQRQYCRYPLSEAYSRPAEEGKVLTPPVRMHTYMNVPQNAPCYPAPPPYSQVNSYMRPPAYSDIYHYKSPLIEPNIYQNVPFPTNPNMMTIRRLCTERERGVPEGASSSQDSKEIYPQTPKNFYSSTNLLHNISKPSSLPHHYCVDV